MFTFQNVGTKDVQLTVTERGIRLHGHDLGHRDEHQRLPRLDRWCVARLVRGKFQPARREARRSLRRENAAGWVTVPLSGGVQIVSGTRYWLAIAATGATSTVGYRDAGTSGSNLDYSGSSATLANPFSIGGHWSSNPASVYLNGTTTPRPRLPVRHPRRLRRRPPRLRRPRRRRQRSRSRPAPRLRGRRSHSMDRPRPATRRRAPTSTSTRPTTRCWARARSACSRSRMSVPRMFS